MEYRTDLLAMLELAFAIEAVRAVRATETAAPSAQQLDVYLAGLAHDTETMIACGNRDSACRAFRDAEGKISALNRLDLKDERTRKILFETECVKLYCDGALSDEDRAAKIAKLADSAIKEKWFPEILIGVGRSRVWTGSGLGSEGLYAYLVATERFLKERPSDLADRHYENLALTAKQLKKHEDVIRWCRIILARPTSTVPRDAWNAMLAEAEEALRKDRKEPNSPHENDIRQMKDLGLLR